LVTVFLEGSALSLPKISALNNLHLALSTPHLYAPLHSCTLAHMTDFSQRIFGMMLALRLGFCLTAPTKEMENDESMANFAGRSVDYGSLWRL
jgi:hypothetical protein